MGLCAEAAGSAGCAPMPSSSTATASRKPTRLGHELRGYGRAVTNARRPTPLEPLVSAIESASSLDGPAKAVGATVRGTLRPGALKDALSGTWLGHALHPILTDVVIGCFMSATLLDFLGGDDDGRASGG